MLWLIWHLFHPACYWMFSAHGKFADELQMALLMNVAVLAYPGIRKCKHHVCFCCFLVSFLPFCDASLLRLVSSWHVWSWLKASWVPICVAYNCNINALFLSCLLSTSPLYKVLCLRTATWSASLPYQLWLWSAAFAAWPWICAVGSDLPMEPGLGGLSVWAGNKGVGLFTILIWANKLLRKPVLPYGATSAHKNCFPPLI